MSPTGFFFQSFWNHCEPLEPMQLAKCLWQQHDTLPSWQKQCCQAIRFAFKSLDNEKKMLMNRCTVQGSPTAPPFFCTTSRSFSIECGAFAGANYYGTGWQVSHKSQGSNIWQKSETLALLLLSRLPLLASSKGLYDREKRRTWWSEPQCLKDTPKMSYFTYECKKRVLLTVL